MAFANLFGVSSAAPSSGGTGGSFGYNPTFGGRARPARGGVGGDGGGGVFGMLFDSGTAGGGGGSGGFSSGRGGRGGGGRVSSPTSANNTFVSGNFTASGLCSYI